MARGIMAGDFWGMVGVFVFELASMADLVLKKGSVSDRYRRSSGSLKPCSQQHPPDIEPFILINYKGSDNQRTRF